MEPIINVIKICGIGIWTIFHVVFWYLPFIVTVLRYCVSPNVPLLMITTSIFEIFFQFPLDKAAVDPHLQSLPHLFLND